MIHKGFITFCKGSIQALFDHYQAKPQNSLGSLVAPCVATTLAEALKKPMEKVPLRGLVLLFVGEGGWVV